MLWCILALARLALRSLHGGQSFQRAHGRSRFPLQGSSVYRFLWTGTLVGPSAELAASFTPPTKLLRPKRVFSNFP